ncbi:MAG TPA: NADH-ubiquinone oxidoreductase-F iron-sulfur binding region domain-containing protein [Candidatus Sumerlaeota bacterium]|nr:NADH-ubiquinone oxidoreductase-F iron-sulfur binding region domain-containing protein [Candidatus Sumerlaeota bacterium]HPS00452.1 NADH-ubiquinone oxidoreductase-F iron-sulfur binding region domain-containing protein [Candidatus Sumerlaeota bacterium]
MAENLAVEESCPKCLETPCLCADPELLQLLTEGRATKSGKWSEENLAYLRRERVQEPVIYVGAGTCGLGAGAAKTVAAAKAWLERRGQGGQVVEVGCIGLCSAEPLMDVQLPGRTRLAFQAVTSDKVEGILESVFTQQAAEGEHVLAQFPQEGLEAWPGVPALNEHPFFAPQMRWVLANCGLMDPTSLDEYIARGGYRALAMTLQGKTPTEVCDTVDKSGLRGRGGGGFPTGKKWKFALAMPSDKKYLICNADEGDPGAFMDRAVIEGDPHRLLEGMAIAAYGMGATKAYVYIRAEYPLAIDRLYLAIAKAKAAGLLGKNILNTGFDLEIKVKKGAGAFVCGEETALIHSVEGRRGMPRPRPPFPAVSGAFGKPTIINNVETLANVPKILEKGAEWFSAVGTQTSKGTKVFALSGKVQRTGLVEVAMGTRMRDIIFAIGGGVAPGRTYKAAQIGGPSGGCIPEKQLDIEIDYESLKTVGAMMGSGGLVVMDDKNCMVDVAKFFMDFIQRESCGKCIPCREGTRRMLEILRRITRRRRSEKGYDALERFMGVIQLEQLAKVIQDTSLCGLGQTAPNPVLSTLRWFRDEYEEHVYDRHCRAGACRELLLYRIDAEKCIGCTACVRKCPADAIVGSRRAPHFIVAEKCIGCGACSEACRFEAVIAE